MYRPRDVFSLMWLDLSTIGCPYSYLDNYHEWCEYCNGRYASMYYPAMMNGQFCQAENLTCNGQKLSTISGPYAYLGNAYERYGCSDGINAPGFYVKKKRSRRSETVTHEIKIIEDCMGKYDYVIEIPEDEDEYTETVIYEIKITENDRKKGKDKSRLVIDIPEDDDEYTYQVEIVGYESKKEQGRGQRKRRDTAKRAYKHQNEMGLRQELCGEAGVAF